MQDLMHAKGTITSGQIRIFFHHLAYIVARKSSRSAIAYSDFTTSAMPSSLSARVVGDAPGNIPLTKKLVIMPSPYLYFCPYN